MIIELSILIIIIVIGIILYPRIRQWMRVNKDKSHDLPSNYQCRLYEDQDKREACERLMTKGEGDMRSETEFIQKR
jgi:hypothetical protein